MTEPERKVPQNRPEYPSDVTDAEWQKIHILLPPEKPKGRNRETDLREVINAITFREETDCTWRKLPREFPPWGTVYSYFRRWNRDGTMSEVRQILKKRAARKNKPPDTLPMSTDSAPTKQSA